MAFLAYCYSLLCLYTILYYDLANKSVSKYKQSQHVIVSFDNSSIDVPSPSSHHRQPQISCEPSTSRSPQSHEDIKITEVKVVSNLTENA